MNFPRAWTLTAILAAALELWALIRRAGGDTLSEQVWRLLRVRWIRPLALLIWGWLTVHFFLH